MKRVLQLLFLFCGIFALANHPTLPQDSSLPPLSENGFPFETGKSPLDEISGLQYFGVILVLIGLLAVLWTVKNRLNAPRMKVRTSPLKFFNKEKESGGKVEVQSITTLSAQSKLVVFEAYNRRYLVILNPNDTTLIDSYDIKSVFKNMLENNGKNNAQ